MPRLTVTMGEGIGESFVFEEQAVLGRSPEADCVLKDLRASRKHSCVKLMEGRYYLEDLKSHNGTFLNGKRIQQTELLKNKDNIRIGATWLTFVETEGTLAEGEIFFGYKIEKEIRQSNTGNFYIASQQILERNVLLWVLPIEVVSADQSSEKTQKDFLSQIRNIGNLSHRNIMMLLDFGATNDYFYCAFECVDLHCHIRKFIKEEHPIPLEKVLELAEQVGESLSYAHSQKVLHLHLTEKTILMQTDPQERVILSEFGVSRFLSAATSEGQKTTTGILGISNYIAPEQITKQHEETEKTDVYAFGCFIYHLLTNQPPFVTENQYELVDQHCNKAPGSILDKRSGIPPKLANLINQCLKKSPDDRQSLDEILVSLRRIKDDISIEQAFHSQEGQNLVKELLGERTLLKWWIFLPLLAVILTVAAFFGAQFIK